MDDTQTDPHDAWVADTFDVDPRNSASPAGTSDDAAPPAPDASVQAGDPPPSSVADPGDPPPADPSSPTAAPADPAAADPGAPAGDPPASPATDPASPAGDPTPTQTADANVLISAPAPGGAPPDPAQAPGGGPDPVSAPAAGAGSASYGDALQKVAEAALQEFLKTADGKALKEKAEKALDGIPDAVKYGVAGSVVAAALAGLAATHQASPITKSPKFKLFSIGGVGVNAEVTWKGPVDKPTESAVMFTFDISLGKDPPKPTKDTSSGAAGPGPSGDNAPPAKQGPPVLLANFDGNASVDKILQELARHTSADGGGQIIVVGYYVPQEAPTDDKPPTGERTDDAATTRANSLKGALGQQVDSSRYSVISDIEPRVSGGRNFSLGADASALGTHDTAVIFVPRG